MYWAGADKEYSPVRPACATRRGGDAMRFMRHGLARGRSMRRTWAEMIRQVEMKGGGLNGLVAIE